MFSLSLLSNIFFPPFWEGNTFSIEGRTFVPIHHFLVFVFCGVRGVVGKKLGIQIFTFPEN